MKRVQQARKAPKDQKGIPGRKVLKGILELLAQKELRERKDLQEPLLPSVLMGIGI